MKYASLLDAGLLIPVIGLIGLSLSIIASTTPGLFVQQLIFFIAGIFLFALVSTIDYRNWNKFLWYLYGSALLFLVISFLGPSVRGATRWIYIAGYQLQPSEMIKPVVLLFISLYFAKQQRNTLFTHLKAFAIYLPFLFLIFKQPDLGNVIIFLFIFIALEIIAGLPWKYFLFGLLSVFIMLPALWNHMKPYQQSRIITFLNPQADPVGSGYNALQAMIALGSGQLTGLGLGRGTQSHLLFLPEYHTDFVYASLGEELGFAGGVLAIIFYLILLSRVLMIAMQSGDNFGRYVAVACFAQIFVQVFINIGMNLGLLPITGITLPLISYGGSSIISTFVDLGLVASVMRISRNPSPIVIQ